ncbi:hypothetical protein GCM10010421_42120 [Streptomyces glaucus]|uniref:DUF6542 domain-containing protein n=1 Tax=Streptomyces glaucus TaxID=284029 RepID=A0ABN3K1M9_9ACTN
MRPPRPERPAQAAGPAARGGASPGGAAREGAASRLPVVRRRSGPSVVRAGRRVPGPRLTGLGAALFCAVAMCVLGVLDRVLFGASPTAYGALFLPVCVLTAVGVRRGDLAAAPVVAPIAFAVGLLPVAGSGDGAGGRLMGFVAALATEAGWLYGGTLVTGAIVLVRRIRLVRRRAAGKRPAA